MSASKPFRVAIVGAGVAGLSLAHALSLANIDHVVLEKHQEPVSNAGAVLFLFPQSARVFDQFGVLEKFDEISAPLIEGHWSWAKDGSWFRKNPLFEAIAERFDRAPIVVDRQQVVTRLYENLPEPNKLLTNKKVVRVEQTEDRVYIHLQDGNIEECDVIVGADGVHSMVREHLWDHNGAIPSAEKDTLVSEYVGLFGISAEVPSLGTSAGHLAYGQGFSVLIFTQPGRVFWTLMYKDTEKRPLRKHRYSEEDIAKIMETLKDAHITESVMLKDLWNTRTRVGMVALEEGVFDHWYSGRAVLIGDAAHKATPDLGLGANLAIEDAVTLANILHRELSSEPNRHLTQVEVSELLQEYQNSRIQKARLVVDVSGQATRSNSFATDKGEQFVREVLPTMDDMRIARSTLLVRTGPKLNYVPTRLTNENAMGWMAPVQA